MRSRRQTLQRARVSRFSSPQRRQIQSAAVAAGEGPGAGAAAAGGSASSSSSAAGFGAAQLLQALRAALAFAKNVWYRCLAYSQVAAKFCEISTHNILFEQLRLYSL